MAQRLTGLALYPKQRRAKSIGEAMIFKALNASLQCIDCGSPLSRSYLAGGREGYTMKSIGKIAEGKCSTCGGEYTVIWITAKLAGRKKERNVYFR